MLSRFIQTPRGLSVRQSWLALAICVVTFAAPAVKAQTDQGAITGIVEDGQGGIIPGAKVTLDGDRHELCVEPRCERQRRLCLFPGEDWKL
jgi:hypothetical protein